MAKALIVDDLVINRFYLRQTLRNMNFTVVEAPDGKVALECIAKDDFEIIFMDIEMPVMNGFETIRAIRQLSGAKAKLKVIAVTSHDSAYSSEISEFELFDGFIAKPISVEKLKKFICPPDTI
jgi:CheY-like chemotaxis protein